MTHISQIPILNRMLWPSRALGLGEVVLFFLVSFFISLAILVPLSGALVRWRVHYNPRRIQLEDAEDQDDAPPNRTVTGFFSTLRRIYVVEGFSGYYKGLIPNILGSLFGMIVTFATLAYLAHHGFSGIIYSVWLCSVVVLHLAIDIPIQILTIRAIITPYKLPWTKPSFGYKMLLSPIERRQPWKLYLLPGILISHLVQLLVGAFIGQLSGYLTWSLTASQGLEGWMKVVVLRLIFAVIPATFLAPWKIVQARLAVQRTRANGDGDANVAADADVAEEASVVEDTSVAEPDTSSVGVEPYSTEDVINLRDAEEPYAGLVDCFKKIVVEEGRRTLFRAWWIYFIQALSLVP
ncbi:hypothetical protein AAF712_008840 [Marasmius tenuissimus]|uniref:Mitochondrial carrier n=1 Tax=Marasmius tenuissimus TaxID=585030 RepID=A0ABR2ZSF8_9AGAR